MFENNNFMFFVSLIINQPLFIHYIMQIILRKKTIN